MLLLPFLILDMCSILIVVFICVAGVRLIMTSVSVGFQYVVKSSSVQSQLHSNNQYLQNIHSTQQKIAHSYLTSYITCDHA
jgi:hypothetical protein